MTDKKNPTDKQTPSQLSDEEAANVKGGLGSRPIVGGGGIGGTVSATSDSCKETTDTGMMGCSG
jgi:hypothetical protein